MGKRVFISYSSDDEQIVSLFVDHILCDGLGISRLDVIKSSGDSSVLTLIKRCELFIMMVSDSYRHSETCLNEMGAAWMNDIVPKVIIVLPNVAFDRMGWLVGLSKRIKITDSIGLDAFHDQVIGILGAQTKILTWNQAKQLFYLELQQLMDSKSVSIDSLVASDDELDFLGVREEFDKHKAALLDILKVLSVALSQYNERILRMADRLNSVGSNPKAFRPEQIRTIFKVGAEDTNELSDVYEHQTPLLREHFDSLIKYAILLQGIRGVPDVVKSNNQKSRQELIDAMIKARDSLLSFRKVLDDTIDLDRDFMKSKNRLKIANDQLIEVISFCISRAKDLRIN